MTKEYPKKFEEGLATVEKWFSDQEWQPHEFQRNCWKYFAGGDDGLLNAPTGSGKTYALFGGAVLDYLENTSSNYQGGLQLLWITPIRALTKDIRDAAQRMCHDLEIPWQVQIRTGDTSSSAKQKQKRKPPEVLITTPESLHLLLATKGYPDFFKNLRGVVVDEWHELMGSKRGVLVELGLSRLRAITQARIWGISATIGNMNQALDVLFGPEYDRNKTHFVKAGFEKEVEVIPILPDEVEEFPWAGHLGTKLLDKVLPIVKASRTTLLFTNTRSQTEIWYQKILNTAPEMAGLMAMHHGSMDRELRDWVEEALHEERLKLVVCTSSLDLGVDFRPVDTIIQVGSPKGVARFMQRAGRSGHRPGQKSRIYFLPTHSLELVESAALRSAIANKQIESRDPYVRSFDVLAQYLVTLSISEGFDPRAILPEVLQTHAYHDISEDEWRWVLNFISGGNASLNAYEEYRKVVRMANGMWHIKDRRTAMRHRLSIGTIVSDSMMKVKFQSGGYLGSIEEWFISRLDPGDVFWFTGRSLELVRIKGMTAYVKASKKKKGAVPTWQGGRSPLSAQLGDGLRNKLEEAASGQTEDEEIKLIQPMMARQQERSLVPRPHQFLIEKAYTREGCHVFMYPFEGRLAHEGLSALIGYRISKLEPFTFSMAFNDYGFELLSDKDIPVEKAIEEGIFSTENLLYDIQASLNSHEMARRKFRDIASIAGLVFTGFPGREKQEKHLQSSSQLFFEVFEDYEPDNMLLRQAYQEVLEFQIEEVRMRRALERISGQEIIIKYPEKPTPFAFPILVDRLRERLSNEKLEDRISRMTVQFGK